MKEERKGKDGSSSLAFVVAHSDLISALSCRGSVFLDAFNDSGMDSL